MKNSLKTLFVLFVLITFFVPESVFALPARTYNTTYLTSTSLSQGGGPISVGGDFRQLASQPNCQNPQEGTVPRANHVTDILNIRYEIWQVGGGNTGIGRTLYGSDWGLVREGVETLCGEAFWEDYDSESF